MQTLRLVEDDAVRSGFIERGLAQAAGFSWTRATRDTDAYRHALST